MSQPLPLGLVVMSREGCGLCEQMLEALSELGRDHPLGPITVLDVDSQDDWQRQFGLKVPVLLLDGSAVCHYTLNSVELLRLLGGRKS